MNCAFNRCPFFQCQKHTIRRSHKILSKCKNNEQNTVSSHQTNRPVCMFGHFSKKCRIFFLIYSFMYIYSSAIFFSIQFGLVWFGLDWLIQRSNILILKGQQNVRSHRPFVSTSHLVFSIQFSIFFEEPSDTNRTYNQISLNFSNMLECSIRSGRIPSRVEHAWRLHISIFPTERQIFFIFFFIFALHFIISHRLSKASNQKKNNTNKNKWFKACKRAMEWFRNWTYFLVNYADRNGKKVITYN